jgi:hypothetical protein
MTGPTPGQARGAAWRRTSRGFYVPADAPSHLPEQRILEQSVRLPANGAVTGWAGCRLHGAAFFDGIEPDGRTPMPVPLAVGPGGWRRTDHAVTLTFDRLPAAEVVRRQRVPVVVAARAAFDAARLAPDVREAVVAVDMAVAGGITSLERLRAHAASRRDRGITGIEQVRRALELAHERSWSPNETRLRLRWVLDARLPAPEVNCPVVTADGSLLGIADLLDPVAGLVVEFDGADHRSRSQHTKDVAKDEALRSHGLEIARFTGPDVRQRDLVVERLLSARRRARFESVDRRRWFAVPMPARAEAALREREARDALYARWEQEIRQVNRDSTPAFRS